jgi:ATP-dependent DNA ligase
MVHALTSGTLRLRFIEPQLPTLVSAPPQGRRWIHEIKHDGYRSQILLESGRVRILTRNGFDWSDRYPAIVGAAERLRCESAIIDGEAIVQDGHGISDFDAIRSAMRWQPDRLMLCAFDLMHLDGKDLRFRSLEERRDRLRALLRKTPPSIQFSEEFVGDAAAFFKACFARGLEGIVSKHLDSAYHSGQSKNWLKTKCFTESEFVVIGMDVDARDRRATCPACQRTLQLRRRGFRGFVWKRATTASLPSLIGLPAIYALFRACASRERGGVNLGLG